MAHIIFVLIAYLFINPNPSSTVSIDNPAFSSICQKDDFDSFLATEGGVVSYRFMTKLADVIAKEKPKQNIIFSPVSINLALALLEKGADGETRQKIQQVTADLEIVLESYSKMFQSLQHFLKLDNNEKSKLNIANGLFAKEGSGMKEDYISGAQSCFDAEVDTLPDNGNEGVNLVNKWVSEKTNGKIPALFEQGAFNGGTHIVLVNAIYMKAQWEHPFEKTQEGPFYAHGKAEDEQSVTYVRIITQLEFWEKDGYQAVVLPYHGDELEMTLVKKIDFDGFLNYEEKKKALSKLFIASHKQKFSKIIDLRIPKFSFRYKVDLKPVLIELGLGDIFSNANFSRMTLSSSKVDKAVHEAFIKVDEKGTEAAGATGIAMAPLSAIIGPPTPVLKFDKPFIFFITHKLTGAQLFTGQVNFIENIE